MVYGKCGRRFVAYLLDFVVQLILIGGIALLFEKQKLFGEIIGGFLLLCTSWLYFASLESSPLQASLGKYWLGLQVVDKEGRRITFLKATGRYFAKFLSRLTLGIGYLMIPFSKKRRGLHDLLASTLVIRGEETTQMTKKEAL